MIFAYPYLENDPGADAADEFLEAGAGLHLARVEHVVQLQHVLRSHHRAQPDTVTHYSTVQYSIVQYSTVQYSLTQSHSG